MLRTLFRRGRKGNDLGIQSIPEVGKDRVRIVSRLIHFVYKQKDRHMIMPQQTPQGQGVRLHPIFGGDHKDGGVQNV